MRAKAIEFVITVLFASVAFGQPPAEKIQDRVFHFTHAETAQDLQEIATVIRAMTEIRQASTDIAQRSLALRGTAGQIALAEWLFNKLDKPPYQRALAQQSQDPATHEYRLPGGGEDVVRVFYLTHAETPQHLQEVATLVRSIGDIRRLFTYNAPRAVALRGTADQMALAEWLFNDLDQPTNPRSPESQNPAPHQYRLPGGADDVVRVFYLTHTETPQEFQEVATLIRSIGDIRRLFTCIAPRALALRGTADQMALAEWLLNELDQPPYQRALAQQSQDPAAHEYRLPGGGDDVVCVYYLTHTETPQELQQVATLVRSTGDIRRLFTYNARRAVALRGTADQIALADRLIKERDR